MQRNIKILKLLAFVQQKNYKKNKNELFNNKIIIFEKKKIELYFRKHVFTL